FLKLNDLSGTISDTLDSRGVVGAFGTCELAPPLPAKRIIGRAITDPSTPQPLPVDEAIRTNNNYMTEVEGMHQADPGDVLVIQGLRGVSNMGGVMASTAFYHGL